MIPRSLRFLTATGAALACALAAAAEPAIIGKARAFVGPEAALNAVHSVHFVGTLVTTDPADPAKQTRAAVEIFFQALPQSTHAEQQRIQATTDKSVEVTALDGYDAWQRTQDLANSANWQTKLLGADQIKRLRANTWESLGFYRGIEAHGGRVEDQGTTVVDGLTCAKLAFIYSPNVIFYRFIDTATGRLVSTETESGIMLREQGEIRSGGIRFPKTIVTTNRTATGQTQTVTLTFEKVTVNETLPASLFEVPGLAVK